MSLRNPRIEEFLGGLKVVGRSSPERWHEFYLFLKERRLPQQQDPPVPFILAASGESAAKKHARLSDQLYWALESGCLEDAIRYLRDLPGEQWDSSRPEAWQEANYPC